ncbi:apses-domain-containing protein [Athelia psychrophila]|uniref:Apses-domain-containing protein n=1 Tax=Athelia psychrophila TaxID=1759441 RepID=A0A166P068_9AGAM|nr:apses-domain-containing protein [Fibularhizoctonia sp. CBS 109695]
MQSGAPRTPGSAPPVKIYNAVYSSVQVYECMVRGIAVMRRRGDSYVNATQILKVAGVDKGRRTKILEKEILPGKHEIVQGGYGKYQGTWIPLERGRDIALQYGVAPLLSPLFDFTPNTNAMGSMPGGHALGSTASPRPLSASSSFSSIGGPPAGYMSSGLAPPPIMPGSALRLLNQGRAQGLFTPSTSHLAPARQPGYASPYQGSAYPPSPFSSTPPPTQQSLKRTRSDAESQMLQQQGSLHSILEAPADIQMADGSRSSSTASHHVNGDEGPSPTKRARKEPTPPHAQNQSQLPHRADSSGRTPTPLNGVSRPSSSLSVVANGNGKAASHMPSDADASNVRFATRPPIPRNYDLTAPLKDARRAAIIAGICQRDDPVPILEIIREISADSASSSGSIDVDIILDDQGHTPLHLAASMARQHIVDSLVSSGADIHRGNYLGETALIRACLATANADAQSFNTLVAALHPSIRTNDTARKTVLHHIVSLAGVKGRAQAARYYLDQIFYWIAKQQAGDFKSLVDLQDEHGDTALNIAARVGNRSLVRTLLDVGANRILPNKLGLRPGDFGVEVEELSGSSRAEDMVSAFRTGPSAPVQKSQDVIADITSMIQGLSTEFNTEVKSKQDSLDVTQAHLRAATRELSEQRKQIQAWQIRCAELDQVNQRVRNLEKALAEEDGFDWTGRTDLSGNDAGKSAGPAFQWRGQSSTMVSLAGSIDLSYNVEPDPPLPTADSLQSLIKLRRMQLWHSRMEELMLQRLKSLQGASAEKEYQCKKIVALCTGITIDKVEEMLENLVIAVESESQIVDIGRVSGFMQKVRDGII